MSDRNEPEGLVVECDGRVATITLCRPERRNALTDDLRRELRNTLEQLNPGDETRVIRLAALGPTFSAGYDLGGDRGFLRPRPSRGQVRGSSLPEMGESRIGIDRAILRGVVDDWLWVWGYRKPIIAQVHGPCLSGGLDLIGVCDLVFAGESATFGHPAGRALGVPMTVGMLPLRIGAPKTKELLFTGDMLSAPEALRCGLVDRVVPDDQLESVTRAFCERIALTPLDALTVHKHVVNRSSELMGARTSAYESADYDAIYHDSPATKEFVRMGRQQGLRAALEWRDGPYE